MSKKRLHSRKKLTLNRETLRKLSDAQLERAHGGYLPTTQAEDGCGGNGGTWYCPNYGGGGWDDYW